MDANRALANRPLPKGLDLATHSPKQLPKQHATQGDEGGIRFTFREPIGRPIGLTRFLACLGFEGSVRDRDRYEEVKGHNRQVLVGLRQQLVAKYGEKIAAKSWHVEFDKKDLRKMEVQVRTAYTTAQRESLPHVVANDEKIDAFLRGRSHPILDPLIREACKNQPGYYHRALGNEDLKAAMAQALKAYDDLCGEIRRVPGMNDRKLEGVLKTLGDLGPKEVGKRPAFAYEGAIRGSSLPKESQDFVVSLLAKGASLESALDILKELEETPLSPELRAGIRAQASSAGADGASVITQAREMAVLERVKGWLDPHDQTSLLRSRGGETLSQPVLEIISRELMEQVKAEVKDLHEDLKCEPRAAHIMEAFYPKLARRVEEKTGPQLAVIKQIKDSKVLHKTQKEQLLSVASSRLIAKKEVQAVESLMARIDDLVTGLWNHNKNKSSTLADILVTTEGLARRSLIIKQPGAPLPKAVVSEEEVRQSAKLVAESLLPELASTLLKYLNIEALGPAAKQGEVDTRKCLKDALNERLAPAARNR